MANATEPVLRRGSLALLFAAFLSTCAGDLFEPRPPSPESTGSLEEMQRDVHSFARPHEVTVTHLDLDLKVDFNARKLAGRASLTLERVTDSHRLYLDTRGLDISQVTLDDGTEAVFGLGDSKPHLGRELWVEIGEGSKVVHIDYSTRPQAPAVQWLRPEQTAAGRHPFLFTQSQAILARTWVPCQDTPGVRMTYSATVQVPPGLMALMSAENPTRKATDGIYRFRMPQAVPSYLLALAVGDLEYRSLGPQSGVYAEPPVVEGAAWELAETEAMMAAVARLYGPYLWGRFDVLVLPPSFPFGGMENPRLTFATPTILAGDRSLVSLIAHELAHSWSGNLVTNATWNDFWLNEGFTVYLERRIMEELHGPAYAEMLAYLGLEDLRRVFEELGPESRDTHLYLDLEGRDPDEGMNDVAYEKGYFFLCAIEEAVGRPDFDVFLKDYFQAYAFQSLTTGKFVEYLRQELLKDKTSLEERLEIDAWVHGPGLPDNAPLVTSEAFVRVEAQLAAWQGGTAPQSLAVEGWSSHEWLHFLRGLPEGTTAKQMAELDAAFGLSGSGNSELLHAWLLNAIDHGYEAAYPKLEEFLTGMGRRKFLKPLYEHLARTEEGKARARRIYGKARPSYHSVSTSTLDRVLDWKGDKDG